MKKRMFGLLVAVALTMTTMAGCAKQSDSKADTGAEETKTETQTENEKLRMAYIENFAAHEFYENICLGAKTTADELGIDLMIGDASGDISKQISLGENYLAQDLDALIVTPADATGIKPLIDKAFAEGIPVVTESVKAGEQTSYVGIKDFEGGKLVGEFAGKYIKDNNLETPHCLLVGLPALEVCVDRVEGFKEGLTSIIPEATFVEVDGQGAKDKAMATSTNALTANPDINVIMGINDDSTLGAVQAYIAEGRDVKKLSAFGFGVEGVAAKNELLNPESPYIGGLGMFPENIGKLLVETAAKAAKGETVEETIAVPFTVLTKDNIREYYTLNGDKYEVNWDALNELKK